MFNDPVSNFFLLAKLWLFMQMHLYCWSHFEITIASYCLLFMMKIFGGWIQIYREEVSEVNITHVSIYWSDLLWPVMKMIYYRSRFCAFYLLFFYASAFGIVQIILKVSPPLDFSIYDVFIGRRNSHLRGGWTEYNPWISLLRWLFIATLNWCSF